MSKFFYLKLAATNLKRNKATYVPYIIAGIGMMFTFLMMFTMASNEDLQAMRGGETLTMILTLGLVVVGIFSVIFITYANSFLLKRRKKELGLYAILGLEKKHVVRVLFYEAVLVFLMSTIGGIVISFVFGKLSFLVLLKMLNSVGELSFRIEMFSLIISCIVFLCIYLFTFIINSIQVRISNPIQLLKGEAEGEKVPRTSWFMTILGVLTLGGGYYISITVKNPLSAIMLFFVAVILVIIGTYALFTSGSIAVLKVLQKNKKFYYKTNNFISVSGMIYRMKQNAAGLANICILSTMVLVMVSGTMALFLGQESSLQYRFPMDITISSYETIDQDALNTIVEETAKNHGLEVTESISYKVTHLSCIFEGNSLKAVDFNEMSTPSDFARMVGLELIPVSEYQRVIGEEIQLESNEVILFQEPGTYGRESIVLDNEEFKVKEEINELFFGEKKDGIESNLTLIVKDEETIERIWAYFNTEDVLQINSLSYYNTNGDSDQKLAFAKDIGEKVSGTIEGTWVQSLEMNRYDWYSTFGGLLYLGIFLGIVFMMATVLIIYFKQISEGMVDRKRFVIMQKVGMSNEEVKKTIKKQILMVFFLPLLTAILHVAFAFPLICRLLLIFGITNTKHIFMCTLGSVAVFIVFYTVVYSLTARVYYKLVQQ